VLGIDGEVAEDVWVHAQIIEPDHIQWGSIPSVVLQVSVLPGAV
jgi:hypothetical protein